MPTQDFATSFVKPFLPTSVTPLIGREQEIAMLRDLLGRATVRLLTLTGPPGVGKTRLALQIANELATNYQQGACFISLAAIRDAELVISTIAQAFNLRAAGERSQLEYLQSYLRDKQMLLVLDNFEQVMTAATMLAALLTAAPTLKLLVTSRLALHLSSEQEFAIAPLALPAASQINSSSALEQYAAIALFVNRAQAVNADFQLNPANAAIIAHVCRQLDGIPLAIELAAARSKLLPPQALLARLSNRLATLTGGARDLPMRQQTLRNAIAWSYDLLRPDEQQLLRRLTVFNGGWTIDAAETVCGGVKDNSSPTRIAPLDSVLDSLAALLDHSLLKREDTLGGETRFTMLQMVREFALEQLAASGETAIVQQSHADYYCVLIEQAEPELYRAEQGEWLNRLEAEHDNFRAALAWALTLPEQKLTLRLVLALGQFWWRHGHMSEARRWVAQLLDAVALAPLSFRQNFKAQIGGLYYLAGAFAWHLGDNEQATVLCGESLTLARSLGDAVQMARSLRTLALVAIQQGEYANAMPLVEESLSLCRAANDERGIAWSLSFLGRTAAGLQDYNRAAQLFEESLTLFRKLEEKDGIVFQLQYLGELATEQEEIKRAVVFLSESLNVARQLGHKSGAADALRGLARVYAKTGEDQNSFHAASDALALYQELGNQRSAAECCEQLAKIADKFQLPVIAFRLQIGAVELRKKSSSPTGIAPLIKEKMGKENAQIMSLEDALGALEKVITVPPLLAQTTTTSPVSIDLHLSSSSTAPILNDLTVRELAVLQLVARGLTYAQIAEQLVVSPRTVDAHLRSIYSKLGVRSRHDATLFALQHNLG